MKTISIFNQVLGPVMRGPSSSHTAGAFHIAKMARSLVGGTPRKAILAFDPAGSYAATYAAQGADRGFAMGLMGKALTEESFFTALTDAAWMGLEIRFELRKLDNHTHPNTVALDLTASDGSVWQLAARSIGGGEVEITGLDGRPVLFDGSAYETLVEVPAALAPWALAILAEDGALLEPPIASGNSDPVRLVARRRCALPEKRRDALAALHHSTRVWESAPVYWVPKGTSLFASGSQAVQLAQERNQSLGRLALAYESQLLGLSEAEVLEEALRRYRVMFQAVEKGLDPNFGDLQLLPACAGSIFQAEASGRLSVRSLHTRAAVRALAVMHVNGAMGVVCAAPTGGSAGVIPGTLVTLAEERSLTPESIGLALLAAGAIGMIFVQRATFAAEVAGCQVEIGAAGAMAAAAVVDAAGGTARQACDAAAISLQNTMGLVCDLLQGAVEIPCHTRNAVASASALINADLILGGYTNFIPLDETIDAVYAVGLTMPAALRCTSKGGLALAPSAQCLKPRPCSSGCSPTL
jgi:L-serine dehydratase